MEARDWANFNAAVDGFTGPAQSIVYADIQGHIGWRASGLIPLRKKGNDGSRILDGSDPSNDWQGFVAQAEMPRVLDPAQGFLATANNRVIGTSFPHVVATEWAGTSRVSDIGGHLSGKAHGPWNSIGQPDKWTAKDSERLQRSSWSNFHGALWFSLREAGIWNNNDPPRMVSTNVGSTTLELNRRSIRINLLKLLLKGSAHDPSRYRWYNEDAWLQAALAADAESWKAAGLGDKQAFLRNSFEELKSSPNWNKLWGEVNEVRIKHPLGLGGGILGWLFNPKPARLSGSSKSIRVVSRDFGQSMRMVVDLADLDATRLVLPLGQSGHLGSKHRLDQYADWQQGDPEGKRTRLHQPAAGAARIYRP
jgi:penicillin amidase